VFNQRLTALSEADRQKKVIHLRADGLTNRAISKRLGLNDGTVSRILSKERKPAKRGGFAVRIGFSEV
jgi:transcriptional regulator